MAKPLSYASTKSVIQYLDPNLRFRISQQCPSLLSTEKAVPLRLNSLKISENSTSVNGIRYNLYVCWQGRASLKIFQKNDVTEERDFHRNVLVDEDPDEIFVNLNEFKDIDRPELTSYHIFLIARPSREDLSNERKLHEATKYLLKKLFGGRVIVKVDELSIDCRPVLRIPASLKFQVHNLQLKCMDNNQLFEAIKPILDFSTPLSSIALYFGYKINYEDPIIRSTEIMYFEGYFEDEDLVNLNTLRHRRVHLSLKLSSRWQNVSRLINNWIEVGREAGFYYSLEMNKESRAREILETVMINHKERIIERPNEDPNSVLLRMKNSLGLHISYDLRETHCLMHLRVQPRY